MDDDTCRCLGVQYLCVLGAVIDDEKEKRLYQGAKNAQ